MKSIRGMLVFTSLLALCPLSAAHAQRADPGSLTSFKGKDSGKALYFRVTGSTSGSVYGSNPYTTDSKLAKAAVHCGALKPGETGVLLVTMADGKKKYNGTSKNGVTTSSWGSYPKSYTVSRAKAIADPGNMTGFKGRPVWWSKLIKIKGSTSGSVWGSRAYTLDSSLAKAAVHIGALKPGETGTCVVTIVPGQSKYVGSTKNGVSTSNWGSYAKSYRLKRKGGGGGLAVGAKCKVEWKGKWYPATVLAVKDGKWKIHYKGFGKKWDEWVGPSRIRAIGGATKTGGGATKTGGGAATASGPTVKVPKHMWEGYGVGSSVTYEMVTGPTKMKMTQTLKATGSDSFQVEQAIHVAGTVQKSTVNYKVDPNIGKGGGGGGGGDAKIERGTASVTVPAGTFQCEWTKTTKGGTTSTAWTCKDVPGGLVKTVTEMPGGMKSTMTLIEAKKN